MITKYTSTFHDFTCTFLLKTVTGQRAI